MAVMLTALQALQGSKMIYIKDIKDRNKVNWKKLRTWFQAIQNLLKQREVDKDFSFYFSRGIHVISALFGFFPSVDTLKELVYCILSCYLRLPHNDQTDDSRITCPILRDFTWFYMCKKSSVWAVARVESGSCWGGHFYSSSWALRTSSTVKLYLWKIHRQLLKCSV